MVRAWTFFLLTCCAPSPDALIALLRRGVPGTEMAATPDSAIPDASMRLLAAHVLSLRTEAAAGAGGRVARGAELFRTRGKCLDCHRLNGEGRPLGPDLSRIGQDRDANWMRRAITDPQAEIYDSFAGYQWTIAMPDNYLLVEVTTKAGEKISGLDPAPRCTGKDPVISEGGAWRLEAAVGEVADAVV